MQVPVRKRRAGSSSHGYVWSEDGAVVAVEDRHVPDLLRIADAGFEIAHPDEDPTDDGGDASDDGGDDTFDEVDRRDDATDRPVKRRPGRPRKQQ